MALKPGDTAPDFEVLDNLGKKVKLSDFRGKKVVLFFYPKDNTPTCTVEACNLRDNYKKLKAKGYHVLGVSPDSVKKHAGFVEKLQLPFKLLADTDRQMTDAYHVWGEKQMFGIKYMGVFRTTFIIDEQGIIERIIEQVKSKDHAAQILT